MAVCKNSQTLLVVFIMVIICISVSAEVPDVINYQGRLTDSLGNPVANGQYDITFKIWNVPEGEFSLPVWIGAPQTIQVTDGLFNCLVGPIPPLVFTSGEDRYLGITVESENELTPRVQLISVPYSYHALRADTAEWALEGVGSEGWVDDGNVVRLATWTDRVGIGTSTASEKLVVGSDIGYFGQKYIVSGSPYLDDVCGIKMGHDPDNHTTLEWNGDGDPLAIHTRQGGVAYNNTLVINGGKVGIGTSTPSEILTVGDDLTYFSGNMITVGDADISGFAGISFGQNADNRGWMAYDNEGDYMYFGTKENGTFYPRVTLDGGRIRMGNGLSSGYFDSTVFTIYQDFNITTSSAYHMGIDCRVEDIGGSAQGKPVGCHFEATGGYSVAGSFRAHGDHSEGIIVSADWIAASISGDVQITGNLEKTSGSFKIDHPLDPANKYLLHSFVESPDMMNIYNGNVVTDANGDAEVRLPDYFESLNKDFRYQLTVIGTFAQAIIAEKIHNGRFMIKTDKPDVEVSWQVTGIRQDPWANEHRIQVEVDKPIDEKGYYLVPGLYGYGEDRSIAYRNQRR